MSKHYRVPFDASFSLKAMPTSPVLTEEQNEEYFKVKLRKEVRRISRLQELLYAHNKYSMLLVFQAMDAAGKDSTIKAVMKGVNPAGCQVASFKQPSKEELDHDFLWRSVRHLPERGRIGVFNRSYYEDVLVVRVHPEYLGAANLPVVCISEQIWDQRLRSIREHERHLAKNGTVVLKFWLNVSLDEQKQRFLSRLNTPDKLWKFSASDLDERACWDDYMMAYQEALNATSRKCAPWYAIPADNKPYMRYRVAKIIRKKLQSLSMDYPEVTDDALKKHETIRTMLMSNE